ncbi:MAG: TetR/AcrR family transcriptional regulator [Candidatus Wallbacteria bacterium]
MSKREELLEVALKLFAEEGYDAVGVQKIVDCAGVTKPTLYHYFGSKEGLLDSMLELYFAPFVDTLEGLCEYQNNIVVTLEGIVFHYLKFARENLMLYKLILNLSFAPEKSQSYASIMKYSVRQYAAIEKMFAAAAGQHGNMKGRSVMFAYTFIGIINSNISFYLCTKNDVDINQNTARKLCKQFMHGIFS